MRFLVALAPSRQSAVIAQTLLATTVGASNDEAVPNAQDAQRRAGDENRIRRATAGRLRRCGGNRINWRRRKLRKHHLPRDLWLELAFGQQTRGNSVDLGVGNAHVVNAFDG